MDERLEDVLEARCLEAAGRLAEARKLQDRAAAKSAKGAAAPGRAPYRGTTPDEKRILAEWDDAR